MDAQNKKKRLNKFMYIVFDILHAQFWTFWAFFCLNTNIITQTSTQKFAMISYKKNEAGKIEMPRSVCTLKDRETHIFCRVNRLHQHTV